MSAPDLVFLTAQELADAYRAGTVSPREVAAAFLDRIDDVDRSINAFCHVDPDRTLAQAREAEQRFVARRPLGPLDGVPIAVKDLLLTEGWPTLRGSRLISPEQPWCDDAPSVHRLRAAGAVFLGKTTTPELGWKGVTDSSLRGITRNPWDPARTAGGSSGGSAAAVAAGMAPLAFGTDGGGSIRIPASFCGVVGVKPTYGHVAQWPTSPFGTLSHIGPIAWTVADAATMLALMAGPDPRDPASLPPTQLDLAGQLTEPDVSGLRIAFSETLGYVDVDPEVSAALTGAARVFEGLGAEVTAVDPGFGDPIAAFHVLWFSGAAKALQSWEPADWTQMDPGLVEIAELGRRYTAVDYLDALETRTMLAQQLGALLAEYDVLVTPTMPLPAFAAGSEVPEGWAEPRWTSWTPFTYPFNMTGVPAVSVPCGFTAHGLPIGMQVVAARFADATALAVAAAYQQAAPLTDRCPELAAPGADSATR